MKNKKGMESDGWLEIADLALSPDEEPKFLYNVGEIVRVLQGEQWIGRIIEQHLDEDVDGYHGGDCWYSVKHVEGPMPSWVRERNPYHCEESELRRIVDA